MLPHLPPTQSNTTPDLQTLTLQTNLRGLQSHLYHSNQHTIQQELIATAPANLAPTLPSLLTPLTGLTLHSLPWHQKDTHLDNDSYTILLQRKLCLNAIPPSLQNTPCQCGNGNLNAKGDHFFRCKWCPKSTLSNKICDTIYNICHHIAPLTDTICLAHDITIKTPNLLPSLHQNKWPANVGIHYIPAPNMQHPNPCLAIDITIPCSPQTTIPTTANFLTSTFWFSQCQLNLNPMGPWGECIEKVLCCPCPGPPCPWHINFTLHHQPPQWPRILCKCLPLWHLPFMQNTTSRTPTQLDTQHQPI